MARLIGLLILVLLPQHAHALPVVAVIQAVWAVIGTYVMVAATVYSIYSSVAARRKARQAAAKARADYLASMTDRRITVLSEDSPRQVIYGEPAPLGGRIVAVLASGAIDQYRHVVVMFACHECEAITDVLIDNDSAFPLRSDGWSTSELFQDTDDDGTADTDDDGVKGTMVGPRLNIQLHTSPGGVDTADAFLMAACPDKWTAAHKASGYTYAVVTFDLRLSRFQSGIPNITARVRGKKVYDPRTGQTAYSRIAALCAADFLMSQAGYGSQLAQIDLPSLIAAANACEGLYHCDGAFETSQERDTTRQQLEDAMVGYTLESGGVWRILAGAWSSPVIALDDGDLLARPEVEQTCHTGTDRHNGAKGTYIKASGDGSSGDFKPYQNAVFLASDGKDKFADLQLPFVGHQTQCTQIAMVRTEQSRGGMVLRLSPKMLGWHLQPGDRLTLTSGFLGFANKRFRVQDWTFSLTSPVALQVIEDEESFYDVVEEQSEDPAPNADLPSPFIAPPAPSSLAAASGPDWMVRQDDTLVPRVRVTWDASLRHDVLSSGRAQVQWRMTGSGANWETVEAPGSATSTFLLGLQTGATYDIRVRFITALSTGFWATTAHTVLGLVDDPAAVAGLALSVADTGIQATWQAPGATDQRSWAYTELRHGPDWADGGVVYSGKATSALLGWLQVGNNLVWAAHANTIGGWSQPVVAALVVQAPAQPVVTAQVQGKAVHLAWQDCRTTQPLDAYRVYVGAALATATLQGHASGTSYDTQMPVAGLYRFWVVAHDRGGNAGAAGYIEVESYPSIDEAMATLEEGLDDVVSLVTQTSTAQNVLGAKVASLDEQLDDVLAAPDYSAAQGYAAGDLVTADGRLYRAQQAVPAGIAPGDAAYWTHVGQADIVRTADSLAAQVGTAITKADAAAASAQQMDMLAAAFRVQDDEGYLADVLNGYDRRATLIEERTVRATADEAMAQQITALSATVGSNSASITQQASAIADVNGRVSATATLTTTVNGHVSGWINNNNGVTSDFVVLTDRFAVATQGPGSQMAYPFTVGSIGGISTVGVDGALLVDKSITARVIDTQSLSALSANLGDVTAGRVRNAGNTTFLNLDASGSQEMFRLGEDLSYSTAGGLVLKKLGLIDTQNLSVNAVTIPEAAVSSAAVVIGTDYVTIQSLQVQASLGNTLLFLGAAFRFTGHSREQQVLCRVVKDGTVLVDELEVHFTETESVTYTTSLAGMHAHSASLTVSGSTSNAGNHSHGTSGTVQSGGKPIHNHSFLGSNTGQNGEHSHSLQASANGSTGQAGMHEHFINVNLRTRSAGTMNLTLSDTTRSDGTYYLQLRAAAGGTASVGHRYIQATTFKR